MVFDLVSFTLSTGDQCRPKSCSGDLPNLFVWTGGKASRRQPDVPRVKVRNSLFALTSSTKASVYPIWATLPGGDRLGRPSPTRAMRGHQPLILFPTAWLNWSKRERLDAIKSWRSPFGKWAKWARLSSPSNDFHEYPLKVTWVLRTQREAVLLTMLLRGHFGSVMGWIVPPPDSCVEYQSLRLWPYLQVSLKMRLVKRRSQSVSVVLLKGKLGYPWRTPCKDGGRDQLPKIVSKLPETRRKVWNKSPSQPQ